MKKIITVLLIVISTIATVGFISYRYAEKIVSYDFEKNVIKSNTYTKVSGEEYNENIDEIPVSEFYTVKIINGEISVSDANLNIVYRTKIDISAFTSSDLKQLEQDGIKFTARSELIEILNYICS